MKRETHYSLKRHNTFGIEAYCRCFMEYATVEEAAAAIVKVKETIEPEPELVKKYEEKYQQFKSIYPALKPVFPGLV